MNAPIPVFDGHNDALLRLARAGGDPEAAFRASRTGHIDLARMRAGGMRGGFFAMFALDDSLPLDFKLFDAPPYDLPLPPRMGQAEALARIDAQATIAARLERAGLWRLVRKAADLDRGGVQAVLHLEGAECIGPDLVELDALHARGLRSLGPVWSRPTIFGEGVPFRYPGDADTGPGLTPAGKRLVRRCRALGMVVDTSHMTMRGFDDVGAEGLPLVATHSNAQAICPCSRNLTDRQLRDIGASGGVVGLNFGTFFLNPDGGRQGAGALDHAIAHLAHMIELAGAAHVALGSDFDGAPMPEDLPDAAALPRLVARMAQAGVGRDTIAAICHGNWDRLLRRVLGPADAG